MTALADPHGPSIDEATSAVGRPVATFADHRQLLDSGECDAVIVATPNMTHVDVMLDVLATDLHVLVEKPLCTTVEDCRRVIDAATGETTEIEVEGAPSWFGEADGAVWVSQASAGSVSITTNFRWLRRSIRP